MAPDDPLAELRPDPHTDTSVHAILSSRWEPQGSQVLFLTCTVFEALLEGERGGGKTDALLMAFAMHVGRGFGVDWRGVIFRKTYKQLRDVVAKSKRWFRAFWPTASFNAQEMCWTFPDGEQLFLSYMRTEDDYWNYHGHAYPFVGWEELTAWADPKCYKLMFSCIRSANPGVPRMVRATTNPYGVGHNWVKGRWRLPHMRGIVIEGDLDADTGEREPERVALQSTLEENRALIEADPGYRGRVLAAARNPSERRAWASGDWNIVAGGMFDDLWRPDVHVVPDFPADAIPSGWRVYRSYDHGSSHPFSAGWHLVSDGEPLIWEDRRIGGVRGDVVRFAEWYGWNGTRNEGLRMTSLDIGKGIRKREDELGIRARVRPGPADTNIFDDYEPGRSVAADMARAGVRFVPANKARKQGWEMCRKALDGSVPREGVGREEPGFFVCRRCSQFLELIPSAPRDDKDLDDVDTEWEDHIADEWRYFMRRKAREARVSKTRGVL